MDGYKGLKRIGSGGFGIVYSVPEHAVKVWKKSINVDTDVRSTANRRQADNCAHEAFILQMLSGSEVAARWVPEFISHDAPNMELHMELMTGFRPILELKHASDELLVDEMVTEIADGLLEMMAALDRVGVAHCDVSDQNVLYREADDGRLELKLVDFGLSTTEELETANGRGYWPAVQNMDMHMVAELLWELAAGQDYGHDRDEPLTIDETYSRDTRDLIGKLHVFHRVVECFHASKEYDDDEEMTAELRELADMELTPMSVLRVWRRRDEVGGIIFKADFKRRRRADAAKAVAEAATAKAVAEAATAKAVAEAATAKAVAEAATAKAVAEAATVVPSKSRKRKDRAEQGKESKRVRVEKSG
jgi:hypothetical protein